MASRTFGSGASSLLRSAQAAQTRENSYQDAIQAYQFELSPKTQSDYQTYQTYLNNRAGKETDPSKALTLQRTQTSAYRSFNSAQIQRASMAVNYGDISKTDKYNQMNGLLNAAVQNGDMNLAQTIESQMGSLSIGIQNDAQAAADKAAAAGKAAGEAAFTASSKAIDDYGRAIDNAFKTGQAVTIHGKTGQLDAPSYAINKAQTLMGKYNLLAANGKDTSSITSSNDWTSLIDSGAVKMDSQGNVVSVDPQLNNLAIKFKTDSFGHTYRDYTAVPAGQNGPQAGLIQPEHGSNSKLYVENSKINADQLGNDQTGHMAYAPSAVGRFAFDTYSPTLANGKAAPDTAAYDNPKSGNTVFVQTSGPGKGLRAVDEHHNLTPDQVQANKNSLVNPTTYHDPGIIPDALSAIGTSFSSQSKGPLSGLGSAAGSLFHFNAGKEFSNLLHPNLASTGVGGMANNMLNTLFHHNANKVLTDEQNARIAAAQAARRAQDQAQLDSFNQSATAQYQANMAAQQRAASIASLQKAAGAQRFQPTFNPQLATVNPQQTAPAKNLQPTVSGNWLQGGSDANIIAHF